MLEKSELLAGLFVFVESDESPFALRWPPRPRAGGGKGGATDHNIVTK
jgi:hypothetical protein